MHSRFLSGRIRAALVLAFFITLAATNFRAQSAQANTEKKIDALIGQLTLDEKIELLSGATMMKTQAIPRLGIPAFGMSDGPSGAHVPAPSTALAAGIGLAASWNPALAEKVGHELGRDARARGAAYLLGPGVNIYRTPMNGRNFEYFGEDPFLAAETVVGYINGLQAERVSATVKHFAANNSEYFRFTENSIVSERALREIYLPAFEAAVKRAHTGAIMDSYNKVNGLHSSMNPHLNLDIAKGDWGFDGLIMSDWTGTSDTLGSVNGGLDLEMPYGTYLNAKAIQPLLASGQVKQATIDDKIRRLLRVAYRFGWMDAPQTDLAVSRYNQQGREVALEGARQGLVLLKNDHNLLPLDAGKLKTIAVIGPDAWPGVATAGGSGEVATFKTVGPLVGLSDKLAGKVNVLYHRGVPSIAQLVMRSAFQLAADKPDPGLTVETFNNPRYEGAPTATRVEPMAASGAGFLGATGADPQDSSEAEADMPADTMMKMQNSAGGANYTRWTGYYVAPQAGDYLAFVEYQGRFQMKIDGKLAIDSSQVPRYALTQVRVPLAAGAHKVVVETIDMEEWTTGAIAFGLTPAGQLADPAAIEMAKKADVVVIAAGYNADIETEGIDREFGLPPGQDELIQKIAAVNKNTIVAITSGGAVDLTPWLDKVGAIVESWYPGQEGGTALAEALLGEVNPSGRLPISWDRKIEDNPSFPDYYPAAGTRDIHYDEGVFVGYRGYEKAGRKPLFPFGYGLSYTTFEYSGLKVEAGRQGRFTVSFTVKNTGQRKGADVAQLYVAQDAPTVARPPQELKGFVRVELAPGESRRLSIDLNPRSFSYWDEKTAQWYADAGSYTLRVGRSSADPKLEGKATLAAPILTPASAR